MEQYIMESGLQVLNKGAEVTFHRENVGTIIDVSLASPKLTQDIVGWAVTNICPSSDHLAPRMVLKLDNMKTEIKWNLHKTYWKGFTEDLDDLSNQEHRDFYGKYDRLLSSNQWHYLRSEEVCEAIEEDIWQCLLKHAEKEVTRPKAPQTHWWNGQLSDMKRKLGYISNAIKRRGGD